MNKLVKPAFTLGIIIIIALLGSVMIYESTAWGPWVYSDSTEYIVSARNLLKGHGLGLYGPSGAFHPLTLHPPFYSHVLVFFGILGVDLVTAARWIDISLFGLTILLVGLSIYAFTKSSWLSVIGSFLLFSMPAMVDVFSGAMSEPTFIFTGLASLFFILGFLRNNRQILLLMAGLSAGLSMLTRYSGVAYIISGVCILLFFSHQPRKRRSIDVMTFGILSCLPTIVWLVWLRIQSLGVRSYPTVNWPEQFINFRLAVMKVFRSWLPFTSLLPQYSYNLARNLIVITIFLFLVLFCLTLWKMHIKHQKVLDSTNGLILGLVMIVLAIAYLFVLGYSYIFTYPAPDLNSRTLLPVNIAVLLGFFSLILFFIRPWQTSKWLTIIPIFLAVGLSISYLHDSLNIVSQYHRYGSGYTSKAWRDSKFLYLIGQLSQNTPIITNESALVLFYTGRPAYDISEIVDREPQNITIRYGDELNNPPQKVFRENGAALVIFNSILPQFQQLYGDQSIPRLENFTRDLSLYARTPDGEIYFYLPAQLP